MDWADGWIPIDEWCERYNERRNTVVVRLNDGTWERGFHIANPDGGSYYVHEERAKTWLANKGKHRQVTPPPDETSPGTQ